MLGVLEGFSVIGIIIVIGVLIDRTGWLGPQGRQVLNGLAFHVATPALLFGLMFQAELSVLFSDQFVATALGMLIVAGMYCVLGVIFKWGVGPTTIGAMNSSYVNSGNLGIPIAVYVLGDGSLVAPVMLVQQLIMGPVMLGILDVTSATRKGRKLKWWQLVVRPFTNPVVIGALSGLLLNILNVNPPSFILEPIALVGGMSVPAVLLAFGMSLRDNALPFRGEDKWQVAAGTVLKSFIHPAIAWLLGAFVFHLNDAMLLAVVVTAALPTAQNIYTYAANYRVGESLARETILVTTILSVPVIFLVTILLHP
ncbi:AEC family transporter [Gulosibacter molinativorax]|uniref:AEC family transporter n=1 Tax=Gulosibacter molinativorax TaxID=256821 RepID=A0ABT7C8V8_9MICO|nr:AEC family transporter [Gulosibacter molinativorax]MDJ1371649.1 AEC family transporter [Gulosibacter molinativorax]QUY61007.1 Putative transport integral membrane protein [Gulosibacter molinativorax]